MPAQPASSSADTRTRRTALAILAAAVVALLVVVVIVVANRGDDSPGAAGTATATAGAVVAPSTADGGAIVTGPGGATATPPADATTLDLYTDFMCPACGAFETANAAQVDELRADGVVVRYHLLSFLDRASNGTEFSTRAANAAATVADADPAHFPAFFTTLFDHQPSEGSDGLTDGELVALATGAGVSQEVADTFVDRRFDAWVAASTQAAFDDGIEHTPTVRIDGTEWTGDWSQAGALTQAVEAARG